MKQKLILWVIALLLGGIAEPSLAAGTSGVRSLTGLKAVRVVIEDLNVATQKTGLRKEQLQTFAEDYLKGNGFTVIQPQERGAVPMVYIRLSAVIGGEDKRAPVSFYLVVQVKQLATLVQGLQVACQVAETPESPPLLATTWESGTMAMLDRAEFFFYVRQILTNLLGKLVQDQQEANKKADE
jgi:hypothetical protein